MAPVFSWWEASTFLGDPEQMLRFTHLRQEWTERSRAEKSLGAG